MMELGLAFQPVHRSHVLRSVEVIVVMRTEVFELEENRVFGILADDFYVHSVAIRRAVFVRPLP